MKTLVLAGFALALSVTQASAQAPVVDHWWKAEECLAATNAPYYVPRVKNAKPPRGSEQVVGHRTGGCFEMELPQEDGGRGWVRLQAGTRVVVDITTGKTLRLEECDNRIYNEVPFPTEKPAPTVEIVQTQPASDEIPKAIDRATSRLSKTIDDAAARFAAEAAKKAEAEPEEEPKPHPLAFLSWNRKSGKITLIGAAVGGALCAKYCRFTEKITVITNVR